MYKIQITVFIAVFLQDINTMEKWCQKFWKMKFSFNGINTEFRKFIYNLLFLFQHYYYSVKQQYQQFFFKYLIWQQGSFSTLSVVKKRVLTLFSVKEWVPKLFTYIRSNVHWLINIHGHQLVELYLHRMLRHKYKTWRLISNPDSLTQLLVWPTQQVGNKWSLFFSTCWFSEQIVSKFSILFCCKTTNSSWNCTSQFVSRWLKLIDYHMASCGLYLAYRYHVNIKENFTQNVGNIKILL